MMADRQRLIAGNWKMYKTRQQAQDFVQELTQAFKSANMDLTKENATQAVLCAPFTALFGLSEVLAPLSVEVGAQNMHDAPEGAYTGEVSADMLLDLGCKYVILGHSERRAYYAEVDESVAAKTVVALQKGLVPIVCVGETLEERESDKMSDVIRTQLGAVLQALKDVSVQSAVASGEWVIAYEPVWAIGTGKSSSADDAQQVIGLIRSLVTETFGQSTGQAVRILYGGSVKPENIATYLAQQDIDGALVGGASLQAASYSALLTQSGR